MTVDVVIVDVVVVVIPVDTGRLADVVVIVVVCIVVDVVDKLVVLIRIHSGVTFILPFLHFKLPILTLNS